MVKSILSSKTEVREDSLNGKGTFAIKDIKKGEGISFTSAGNGIVDFDYMLQLLCEAGYDGPMILHGIKDEEEFPKVFSFMKERITVAGFRLD